MSATYCALCHGPTQGAVGSAWPPKGRARVPLGGTREASNMMGARGTKESQEEASAARGEKEERPEPQNDPGISFSTVASNSETQGGDSSLICRGFLPRRSGTETELPRPRLRPVRVLSPPPRPVGCRGPYPQRGHSETVLKGA